MIRFLHTADWQLGAHLAFLGERASRAREIRLETVARIVKLAVEESVDFVVAAGDTFDSPDVSDGLLRRVFRELEQLGEIPIFLLPGNHDPARPGGVWERSTWNDAPPCVRPMLTARPTELRPGVMIYPCPIGQKTSRRDPTAWIPAREPGDLAIRVGLAHGGLDRLPVSSNFPIAASRGETSGLDYVALGDWHTPLVDGRMAYSGAPEPCGFRERDSGHVLLVEVAEAGAQPKIEQRRVAGLVWQRLDLRLDDLADLERLKSRLHEPYAGLALDIQLDLASAGVQGPLESLLEVLESEAFFCRCSVRVSYDSPLDPGQLLLAAELDGELSEALAIAEEGAEERESGGGRPGSEVLGAVESGKELSEATPAVLREARRQLALLAQKALQESSS